MSLAQAKPACLGDNLHINSNEFLVFLLRRELLTWAKTSDSQSVFTCRAQKFTPKIPIQHKQVIQASNKHKFMQSKSSEMISIRNLSKADSFPYL